MSVVFRKSKGEVAELWQEILTLKPLVMELWANYIIPDYFDIREIISGNFVPSSSSGEGEPFGVPTESELRNIYL